MRLHNKQNFLHFVIRDSWSSISKLLNPEKKYLMKSNQCMTYKLNLKLMLFELFNHFRISCNKFLPKDAILDAISYNVSLNKTNLEKRFFSLRDKNVLIPRFWKKKIDTCRNWQDGNAKLKSFQRHICPLVQQGC